MTDSTRRTGPWTTSGTRRTSWGPTRCWTPWASPRPGSPTASTPQTISASRQPSHSYDWCNEFSKAFYPVLNQKSCFRCPKNFSLEVRGYYAEFFSCAISTAILLKGYVYLFNSLALYFDCLRIIFLSLCWCWQCWQTCPARAQVCELVCPDCSTAVSLAHCSIVRQAVWPQSNSTVVASVN